MLRRKTMEMNLTETTQSGSNFFYMSIFFLYLCSLAFCTSKSTMSFVSQGRSLAFPFRVGCIHKIFADKLDSVQDQVTTKVFSRYDPTTGSFREKSAELLDVDQTIILNLSEYETNDGINENLRNLSQGIRKSISRKGVASNIKSHSNSFAPGFKAEVQKNTTKFSLPEEMIKTFEDADAFAQEGLMANEFRKSIVNNVALQGAEFIQHMFRLSAKFLQNNMDTKIMYRTNQGFDEMGLYRVTLYCDLTDHKEYYKQIQKLFTMRNVIPESSTDQTFMLPFVFLVMVFKSPDSNNAMATDLYIKFQQDLANEYNQFVEPLMRQAENTDAFPYNPRNVPRSFWTLHYVDQGIEDLAARVVIRSYPDFFPPLDTNTLADIWRCNDQIVPCFRFESIVKEIGKDMLSIIKARNPSYLYAWNDFTDFTLREYLSHSPYARCDTMDADRCSFPLPTYIRSLFTGSLRGNHNPISHTKNVVNFFVLSYDSALRKKYSSLASSLFSQEDSKEMFPANDQIAAIVYHVVVSYSLYTHKDKIKWTNQRRIRPNFPEPWQVLIQRCNDINSPTTAISNFTGLRRFIQHLDLLLFSFVGGYIMQANDQKCAIHFRKIRVALLRMGYLETKDLGLDYQGFVHDANSPGLVHRLEETQQGYNYIRANVLTSDVTTAGFSQSDSARQLEPNYTDQATLNQIDTQASRLNASRVTSGSKKGPQVIREPRTVTDTQGTIDAEKIKNSLPIIAKEIKRITTGIQSNLVTANGVPVMDLYNKMITWITDSYLPDRIEELDANERTYLSNTILSNNTYKNPRSYESQSTTQTLFETYVLALKYSSVLQIITETNLSDYLVADVLIHYEEESPFLPQSDKAKALLKKYYYNVVDDSKYADKYHLGLMVANTLGLIDGLARVSGITEQDEYLDRVDTIATELQTMSHYTPLRALVQELVRKIKSYDAEKLADILEEIDTEIETSRNPPNIIPSDAEE